ncbi:MAG: hypothetical protein SGJ19_22550 [Planctomycetia bacterium]|nr:hypothetical protein [Planctomycetia bacterium]
MEIPAPIVVFVIGDDHRPEFRDILPTLRANALVTNYTTLEQAREANGAPELCVFLQSVPGEYAPRDLELLLLSWPLARFLTIAGPLCEGEPRTGAPWPGQLRVYWHAFPGWWRLQLARLAAGECAAWQLPRTSREDDVLRGVTSFTPSALEGTIGVAAAHSREAARLLVDSLRNAGIDAVPLSAVDNIAVSEILAIVWDDDAPGAAWRERFSKLCTAWPGTPTVALLNFPRPEDRLFVEANMASGASGAIIAKPFDFDAVLATLVAVAGARTS